MAYSVTAGAYRVHSEEVAWMSVRIDGDAIFQQVMATPQVEAAVHDQAVKIAQKARRLSTAAGRDANIRVERVDVPSGRVSYNVVSDDVDGEYGNAEMRRLRTLRRAAGGD